MNDVFLIVFQNCLKIQIATKAVRLIVKISNFAIMDSSSKQPYQGFPISAVIITYNGVRTIDQCLSSLKGVVSEIIVLDSYSTDGTVEVCRRHGVKLINQEWLGYSATKNLGNSMAQNDWILSIDSDEVLSDELRESVLKLVPQDTEVYAMDRLTNYCGKWIHHSGWYPDWKVRLFNRKHVQWQGEFVHETLDLPPDIKTIRLSGKLLHYSYAYADDHYRRMEKYAQLSAKEKLSKGKKATLLKYWLSPAARFLRTFFWKLGFLDGKAGWDISRRNAWMVRRRYQILKQLWEKDNS